MTHNVCNAEINLEQLAGIVPFVVAVDERLRVTWASEPVLRRVKGALGLEISEIIEFVEPREEISHSSIARNRGVKQDILLKNQGGPVPLTGEWLSFRDGFLLLAGPDASRPEGLDKFSFDDFPEDDPTIELLTAREAHIRLLKEARSAGDALREKNKIIEESNQRLELVNAELEKEIVERKRAEEALRQNEERLGLALRGGDLGTWDWNIRTGEVRFNERWATMLGYSRGEVEPRLSSWEKLMHPEDLPGVYEKLKAHLEGETSFYEAEFRMRHKSGEWVWILDKGRVIEWDEDDNPVRACGTHMDITDRRKARKKLEESHDIMNKSPVVVFLWRNAEGWPVEHVSENVKDLFGYTAEEFMSGKVSYVKAVHPDDLERVGAEASAYSEEEGRKEFSQEYRIITRAGKVEWTDDRTLIRRNEKGEITHYQGTILGITERKKAEEALRENEAQKQAILDASIDMIMLVDTQMKMVWANKNAAKVMNKNIEDLVGHGCYKFFRDTDKPCPGCPLEKAMKTGKIERSTMYHPARDTVGESYWDNYAVPLKDGSGRITGAIEIARDITERKRAEEETRRLAAITEQAVEGIAVADLEGNIQFANRAWALMHGYESGDELVGENLSIFHTEEQLKTDVIPFNEEVMRRGYNFDEMGHVRRDGTTFQTTMTVTLMKDEQGAPYGLAAFMQDITERKKAEKDLKKAQTELIQTEKLASLGQLAAGIAHEINTPSQFVGDNIKFLQDAYQDLRKLIFSLTGLLSSAKQGKISEGLVQGVEQAVKEADLDFLFDEIPKAIEQSQEGVQRISHIVRSMKQFSHPGAKDKTLADINACIETTVTVCRNEWKYAAEMVMDLDRSMPPVPLYQNEFNQVILNIILNAALAIKEALGENPEGKGTITITTGRDQGLAEVRIQDTGTGIPEEIRGKIFDPFFTSREVGKGTGQGLAISYSVIVEKHGGTLSFETEMGKGTTFIIRLPLE